MNGKILSVLISAILVLSTAISMTTIPNAAAHSPPWTIQTYAFINVAPNPVGVGQVAYINFWVDKVPPTSIGQWGYKWHGMEVTITKPNGDLETLKMGDSDAAGGTWASFIPDQVGTYKFEGKFPAQTVVYEKPYPYGTPTTMDYVNDTYTASNATTTLTVQEQPIQTAYPSNPLPKEYWTRPINSMNREWATIGGNWLGLGNTQFGASGLYNQMSNFNPYTEAPGSAHILWTKPEAFGGQIGGEFGAGDTAIYSTGTAYEAKFSPVILNGILYYTQYPGAGNDPGALLAVDIRTGQTLWTNSNATQLRCGMVYNFKTGDQYGAHAYLFTVPTAVGFIPPSNANLWSMLDAMTGQWILNIANATPGTLWEGQNGEILSYRVSGGNLSLFNMSKCIAAGQGKYASTTTYSPAEIWRPPQGATIDWNGGYEWSVPVQAGLSLAKISDNVILLTQTATGAPGGSQGGWRVDAGYSAIDGHLLWGPVNRTLTPWTNVQMAFSVPAGEGIYTAYNNQEMKWTAYDITTGKELWTTQPKNSSWGYYDYCAPATIGYGNLYVWGLSGEVYAYDAKTGQKVWGWNAGAAGVDSPYGTWPLGSFPDYVLADGKLYVFSGHDYTPPVFKGAKIYCLNATTGELIWDSLSFEVASGTACADGVLARFNGYDNQIYGYGKGPSKLTVDAPSVGVTTSTPVTIKGTITDISAGSLQQAVAANFPNGLPCVSDASQGQFMDAVYQQQSMPSNLSGVPVTINVVDSNGNYRTIGTAMSNAYGTYSLTWTPDISGDYTVIANFAGTESYYLSDAATAFHASELAATPSPQPVQTQSMADLYLVPGFVGVIIAIIVVGAAIILLQRKRP